MKSIFPELKKLSKTDIAAVAVLSAIFIYLFASSFFDGTISDEAFYITIPMRIMNGDGLFTDEWHLSQLSAVLLYLPFRLFYFLSGSTEGIILYFRLLFCIMQGFTGAVIYKTLRKYGAAAVIISSAFMLFSVISLNTLSYNTMGVSLLMLLVCTLYSLSEKPSPVKMLASGALIAMFILCQPVGVVYYIIYFIAVCIFLIIKAVKKVKIPYPFELKSFALSVAGILPVLGFFCFILLKNSDIGSIIDCIPGIMSDVEHMEIAEELGVKTFSLVQFFSDMSMAAGTAPLVITVITMILAVIIKRKNKTAAVITVCSAFAVLSLVFYFRLNFMGETTETDDINFYFLPLAVPGIFFYLLSDKKNHNAFVLFWCTGILYALFMTISSNLALHASVNGYIIASAGSVIAAADVLNELRSEKTKTKLCKTAVIFIAACIFGFTIINSTATCVSSAVNRAMFKSSPVTTGIYKGIKLPTDQALTYTRIHNDAERMEKFTQPDDRLFVIENVPAMYLESELPMGAHSGWFICNQLSLPEIRDRFREYYKLNPENIPDYLYVPAYTYTKYGLEPIAPKIMAQAGYTLFECDPAEDVGSGLLIKVTGIKDE